jgi:hypothetical protein
MILIVYPTYRRDDPAGRLYPNFADDPIIDLWGFAIVAKKSIDPLIDRPPKFPESAYSPKIAKGSFSAQSDTHTRPPS